MAIPEIKHIKPEDPEFEELAKTITPIHYVRKDHFGKTNGIYGNLHESIVRRKSWNNSI